MNTQLRNVAIIAHVDHGKTTLVDALLRQSQTRLGKELEDSELIMDSNELEKERGITIFSKNASVRWHSSLHPDQEIKINIIDTPGHADFGGEVERVLQMADGCLLLVDAKEGPMPQTRFVLKKALFLGLRIIVVINKIDKPGARPDWAVDKTFDLFCELGAPDHLADFPVIYSASKQGKAGLTPCLEEMFDISPIFDEIIKHIPAPTGEEEKPLQLLITTISGDKFKGRIATGRVANGTIKAGQEIAHINREGIIKKYRLLSLMSFEGLRRVEVNQVEVGDICAVAGIIDANIGETVADPINPSALPLLDIEEPTVKMTFLINDSPFAGKEGQYTTSRQIRERLYKELETDMALRVEDIGEGSAVNGFVVSGRGELHLAILIERMRREGYEFSVSQPKVITRRIDGREQAPFEQLSIEVPDEFAGRVIEKIGARHGQMEGMKSENGITYLDYIVPTRGLFGFRNEFLTNTKGLGIASSSFHGFQEDNQVWRDREQGSMVASESGKTLLYGLSNVQDQGQLFFGPGVDVYKGQVVGQNSRPNDLRVNVCKEKQLSNMRSKGSGVAEHFDQPRIMGLEESLEYIGDDELVEVTPKNIRIRKMILDENDARRKARGIKS